MELRDLEKVNPMTVDFHGLSVTFNPDAFTAGFFYAVAEQFKNKISPLTENLDAPKAEPGTPKEKAAAYIDELAGRIRQNGEFLDGEKAFFIALLMGTPDAPVLLSWDLTNNGAPIPCNEEGLNSLQGKTLKGLWETVRNAPDPKSQGIGMIPQNQTTSETTQSLSVSPEIHKADDPVM